MRSWREGSTERRWVVCSISSKEMNTRDGRRRPVFASVDEASGETGVIRSRADIDAEISASASAPDSPPGFLDGNHFLRHAAVIGRVDRAGLVGEFFHREAVVALDENF